MKKLFLLLLIMLAIPAVAQMKKSEKRGVGENAFNNEAEVQSLSSGVSWAYDWGVTPSSYVIDNFGTDKNMEFVPMCWNGNFDEASLRAYIRSHPGVKYILGFNEPNFASQSNMTPSQAAAAWPKVEKIAADFNLKIVAPALNYTDGPINDGVTYQPEAWMDAFLAAYPTAKFDYLALHCYMNSSTAMMNYIEHFAKKYKKQVWLTEFCAWEGTVDSLIQLSTMVQKVQALELSPMVARYAWFKAKGSASAPYYRLLINQSMLTHKPAIGTLSQLGVIYLNMSSFDSTYYHPVGEIIAAKDYVNSVGLSLELNSDAESSQKIQIGSFDIGSYTDYMVHIPETGEYEISFRLSSEQFLFDPKFQIFCDGINVGENVFPETGMTDATDKWATQSMIVNLPAGDHKLRVRSAQSTTCKFNWFRINQTTGINEMKRSTDVVSMKYYDLQGIEITNPVRGVFIEKKIYANGTSRVSKIIK